MVSSIALVRAGTRVALVSPGPRTVVWPFTLIRINEFVRRWCVLIQISDKAFSLLDIDER